MKGGHEEVKKTSQRKHVAKEITKNKTKKTTRFKNEGSKKNVKREKTRRKRNHKGPPLSLEDQQKRNSFFTLPKKKRTVLKETIKKMLLCEEGRVCKRRNLKK